MPGMDDIFFGNTKVDWTVDCGLECEVTPQLAGRHMFWLVVYIYDMMIGDLW